MPSRHFKNDKVEMESGLMTSLLLGADIEHNQILCADITMTSEYVPTSLLYQNITT